MGWTNPRTRTAVVVDENDLNEEIRDNMLVVKTSINDDGTLKAAYPLHKNSGSSVSTTATNVDTFAISGLSVDDALDIYVTLSQITNNRRSGLILHEITAHRIEQFKRERLAGKWRGHKHTRAPKRSGRGR